MRLQPHDSTEVDELDSLLHVSLGLKYFIEYLEEYDNNMLQLQDEATAPHFNESTEETRIMQTAKFNETADDSVVYDPLKNTTHKSTMSEGKPNFRSTMQEAKRASGPSQNNEDAPKIEIYHSNIFAQSIRNPNKKHSFTMY